MAALDNSDIAQITCRADVARAGCSRANVTDVPEEIKEDGTGEVRWDMPTERDTFASDNTNPTYTTVRD